MSEISRVALFGKLNPLAYKAVESATVFCKLRGNPYVELVHWIAQIVQLQDSDLHRIVQHFGIDPAALARDITVALDRLPRGATSITDLSSHLENAVERGWVYGTLTFGESQVRTGHLVVGILKTPSLRAAFTGISRLFERIRADDLTEDFRKIVTGSPEEGQRATDGTLAGATPGEASAAMAPAQMGKQEALKRFAVDLTERARKGELDPVTGRDEEIRQIVDILMRRRQNNPILTGEAGVGKTAVVEGFAARIARGDVPPPLVGVSILNLDIGLLQAGASMKGEFEQRLRQVIEEVQASPKPIILFIDEAHTLIGAGGAAGTGDAANLLKPALARGTLRTIAATTWAEYKKHIEKDPALTRRFQVVKIEEPGEPKALGVPTSSPAGAVAPPAGVATESTRPREERERLRARLRQLQSDLARLQGETPLIMPTVDAQAVAAVVADWTGIPAGRMVKNEIEAVLHLADALDKRVIGQRHALEMIARRIQTSRAKLDNPNKPIGVFMLCGPSGVGKTETALALAEALYGGEQNVITINMREFQEAHTVSTLKGSPPGYVGYGEGGVLTEAVRRRPYSVVLLDEVEKAHPDVHEIFFQVFDKGWMEDAEGRYIDFKNTIILLTSNAGTDLITSLCKDPELMPVPDVLAKAMREPLLKLFPPALLGRLVVIPYYPLSDDVLGSIVRLQLERIRTRVLENHRVPFDYDEAAVRLVISRCTEAESGGRMIDAILTNTVVPRISVEFLERMASASPLRGIALTAANGDFVYRFE